MINTLQLFGGIPLFSGLVICSTFLFFWLLFNFLKNKTRNHRLTLTQLFRNQTKEEKAKTSTYDHQPCAVGSSLGRDQEESKRKMNEKERFMSAFKFLFDFLIFHSRVFKSDGCRSLLPPHGLSPTPKCVSKHRLQVSPTWRAASLSCP